MPAIAILGCVVQSPSARSFRGSRVVRLPTRSRGAASLHLASTLHGSRRDVAPLNQLGVALDHLERSPLAFAPETDVELVLTDAEISHSYVMQPTPQQRVDAESVPRCI